MCFYNFLWFYVLVYYCILFITTFLGQIKPYKFFFPILFPCLPWKYSYLERMPLRHHSYFLLRHPFLGLPERCPFFKTLHYGALIPLSCIIHLRYSLIDSLITTAHSFSSKELNPFSLEHACLSGLVLA